MHDIESSEDVRKLVDTFYQKVKADPVIGYIFNDVVHVDWAHHLPKMYAFWEFLLLDMDTYRGNPIEPHHRVHALEPLRPELFDRWIQLFQEAVDENFAGEIAEKAKFRAFSIAETWKPKFSGRFAV